MTEGPLGPISPETLLADLHRLCATTAAAFREGHQMTVGSQEQTEKVLVWLSGLMGAGIFSVQGLLASAPLSMRLTTFAPWTLGILSAMLGRLLAGELKNKNDMQHFKRISMLGLLQLETDKALIAKNLRRAEGAAGQGACFKWARAGPFAETRGSRRLAPHGNRSWNTRQRCREQADQSAARGDQCCLLSRACALRRRSRRRSDNDDRCGEVRKK